MRMPDLSESNHFITLTASKYQLKYTVLYHLNDSSFQNRHFFQIFLVNSRKQQEREAKIKEEIDRLKRQKRQDNHADFDPSRLYQRYEGWVF